MSTPIGGPPSSSPSPRSHGIDVQKADGRVVAGAAAIVSRGDRFELIQQHELVQVEDEDDLRRRPRLEQAFTGAIRAVVSTDHPKACFSAGHGEMEAQALRTHLVRSGYDQNRQSRARTRHPAADRTPRCALLVIAAPTERVAPVDVARYEGYVAQGGSALIVIGARPEARTGVTSTMAYVGYSRAWAQAERGLRFRARARATTVGGTRRRASCPVSGRMRSRSACFMERIAVWCRSSPWPVRSLQPRGAPPHNASSRVQ